MAVKKTAKKVASKKAAAHKARGTGIGDIKLADDAKVTVVVKDPPGLHRKTKWAARLKKVYAHRGKKVGDFAGPKSDIKWAIHFGLVKAVKVAA